VNCIGLIKFESIYACLDLSAIPFDQRKKYTPEGVQGIFYKKSDIRLLFKAEVFNEEI